LPGKAIPSLFLRAIMTVLDIVSAGFGVTGLWRIVNPTLID
jgi:hypothetical protein